MKSPFCFYQFFETLKAGQYQRVEIIAMILSQLLFLIAKRIILKCTVLYRFQKESS